MRQTDFFHIFTDRMNTLAVRYMVTGSAAVIAYGEPRLTNDIDIVLQLKFEDLSKFIAIFPEEDFYCPPEEILKTEILRPARGHFNIIHLRTGLKADCYLSGDEPFQKWALDRRQSIRLGEHVLYFAPLEYVIIKKLKFYEEGSSEKHLRDIRSLFSISAELIDRGLVEGFVREFKLESSWAKVFQSPIS